MNEKYEKYKDADPSKKNVFINYDAIDSLPESLEPSISELKFDPKKLDEFFTNTATENKPSWYPQTDTYYKIADMCGISGESDKKVEWIPEIVDINPVLMKPFGSEPTKRKMIVGARVTKQSKVLCEDGAWRVSPPETNEFNFFDRACIEFLSEEEKTNNYTTGKKQYYKYNTVQGRQKRLLSLKKFAISQAETKAFCKTVRVLAGLPTGFDTADLQEGKLVFCKFVKSKRLQKLETAARLEAIRKGNTKQIQNTSNSLFNNEQIEPPLNDTDTEPDMEPEKKQETKKSKLKKPNPFEKGVSGFDHVVTEKEKLKNIIEQYYNENSEVIDDTKGAKEFIVDTITTNYEIVSIENLKSLIKQIEKIETIKIINHGINLEDNEDIF